MKKILYAVLLTGITYVPLAYASKVENFVKKMLIQNSFNLLLKFFERLLTIRFLCIIIKIAKLVAQNVLLSACVCFSWFFLVICETGCANKI